MRGVPVFKVKVAVVGADHADNKIIVIINQFLKILQNKFNIGARAGIIVYNAVKAVFHISLEQIGPAVSLRIPGKSLNNRISVLVKPGTTNTMGNGISQQLDMNGFFG